jgi:hypothetical protein
MSDVIWAAGIAGAVGISGTLATIRATSAQLRSHERVEAQRIGAEKERQHAEHIEAERQRRCDVYAQFLTTLSDLDRLGTWATGTNEEISAALERYDKDYTAVMVAANDAVADSLGQLAHVFMESGAHMAVDADESSLSERFRDAYRSYRIAIIEAGNIVLLAMREDIRRGYEDPAREQLGLNSPVHSHPGEA